MDLSLATIVLWAVPVVFAITLHEAAHGYVARQFGDQTAYMLGRVTLNPLKHIDPIGTIAVPGFLIAMSVLTKAPWFIFGWAKPVPVQFANLRNPKRDMFWVAVAGPMANLVMAIGWGFLLRVAAADGTTGDAGVAQMADAGVAQMADAGVQVNLMLMALNLLPILPLDGGRVAVSLLPHRIASAYARLERYGFVLVIILLATGILGDLMQPLLRLGTYAVDAITGL
jgi:Zn-dependent protease